MCREPNDEIRGIEWGVATSLRIKTRREGDIVGVG